MTDGSPDVERLAELDADIAAGLAADPGATADPVSRAVLDALAATRAELAALPEVPVPPELAARLAAALHPALTPTRVDETGTQSSPIRHAEPGPPPRATHHSCVRGGIPDPEPPTRVDEINTPSRPIEHAAAGAADAPHDEGAQPRRTAGRTRRRGLWHPFPRTDGLGAPEDRQLGARAATSGRERTNPVITPGSRAAGRGRAQPPDSSVPGRRPARPPGSPARRRRVRPAIAVGLALAGLLVVAGVLQARPAQQAVTASDLGGVARAAVGAHDAGELTDPVRRAGCLRSVGPPGLDPGALLLGGRGVEFEGRPGILLVLATGRLGTFRVVVVDPACSELLADTLIGR